MATPLPGPVEHQPPMQGARTNPATRQESLMPPQLILAKPLMQVQA
jgi:hypothetical protein